MIGPGSRPKLLALLLVLPMSSYLLSGRYAAQREAIRAIARYLRDSPHARIPGGLGWVAWSRRHPRPNRLVDWLIPMLLFIRIYRDTGPDGPAAPGPGGRGAARR